MPNALCCIWNNEFRQWNVCLKIYFVFVRNVLFFILESLSPFYVYIAQYQLYYWCLNDHKHAYYYSSGTHTVWSDHLPSFIMAKLASERECVNVTFVMVSTKAGLRMPCIAAIICVRPIACYHFSLWHLWATLEMKDNSSNVLKCR